MSFKHCRPEESVVVDDVLADEVNNIIVPIFLPGFSRFSGPLSSR